MRSMTYEHALFRATQKSPHSDSGRNAIRFSPRTSSLSSRGQPIRFQRATATTEEWEIYASLILQSKPVDLIFFPDGVHELEKPLERLASQQGNVDWFRFWLKGEEDPDPAKVEQYKRRRELRKLQEASESSRKRN